MSPQQGGAKLGLLYVKVLAGQPHKQINLSAYNMIVPFLCE